MECMYVLLNTSTLHVKTLNLQQVSNAEFLSLLLQNKTAYHAEKQE